WITMALCFLQVLREPVVQYLAGSEQRIAPFWNIITWYPTQSEFGKIILPFTVLRRLECVLEPTREAVLEQYEAIRN
ncbi:type I restriction-modification system subunit M N-terminal domain-containing protein, partial [Thiolapillus sp.]